MFIELKQTHLGRQPGERVEVDDAVARSLVAAGIADELPGNHLGNLIDNEIAGTLATLTRSVNDTITKTLQEFAKAQMLSRRNAVPRIFGEGHDGDVKRTFGSFLLAVRNRDHKALEEMGSSFADWGEAGRKAALTTATGIQGGYTVPIEFLPRLMSVAAEQSIVRPRATIIPMAATTVEIPALDVTTAPSAGDTAFFGGLSAAWTEEAASLTEDEPSFKQVRLTAHELSGYSVASNALVADNAVGLEALLTQLFGGAIAWYEDYAFLRGNGVGKPLGIISSNAFKTVTRSGASAFVLADAASMFAALLPGWSTRHTVWAMHPNVFAKLLQLGTSGLTYLDNSRDKPTMTLFGITVVVSEKLPALNTAGDVILCDLRHYLIGERLKLDIAYSEHYRFVNNQGAWRFVQRVDGQPWMRSAITLSDGTTTMSPFVGLAAG